MNRSIPILIIFLILAFSGCTGQGTSQTVQDIIQKFDRPNPNLDGKIVDVKFDRDDIRAGEIVATTLIITNTGNEVITNETIDIIARVKSLDDFLANLALKTMSDQKKTANYSMDFDTEIKPGTNGKLSAVFHTVQEMQGRNLAGKYDITVILSVNGQKADAKKLDLTLYQGTPREFTPTPTPSPTPSPTPTPSLTPASTPEIIETPVPTPTPTPTPVVVATPTGNKTSSRVTGSRLFPDEIKINAGDELIWDNRDETVYTIVEMNNKLANITLPELGKAKYIFNTTGDYKFGLYYRFIRGAPSTQTILVRVNSS